MPLGISKRALKKHTQMAAFREACTFIFFDATEEETKALFRKIWLFSKDKDAGHAERSEKGSDKFEKAWKAYLCTTDKHKVSLLGLASIQFKLQNPQVCARVESTGL